jgi:hypothetical protein
MRLRLETRPFAVRDAMVEAFGAASGAVVYDDQATPFHGRELEQVTQEWRTLKARAGRIARRLPDSARTRGSGARGTCP